tara:strand:+ start:2815 stop:3852 length:1038 start_codon:yes stop_codon:yes gene_type:complete
MISILFVLCTGMFRSASTWSFNICKTILSNKQTLCSEFNQSVQTVYSEKVNSYDNILLKCHNIDGFGMSLIKNNSVKVIHTYREPLAAISSGLQTFKDLEFENIIVQVKIGLELMEVIRKCDNVLTINYDEIINNPKNVIKKISTHLGYDLKNEDIQNINSQFKKDKIKKITKYISKNNKNVIDIGFSMYDKNTLFHKNHVLNNIIEWKEFLSNEQKQKAIASLQPFVDKTGSILENIEIDEEAIIDKLKKLAESSRIVNSVEQKKLDEISDETKKIIDDTYMKILGRHVDDFGLTDFAPLLEKGKINQQEIGDKLKKSAEYSIIVNSVEQKKLDEISDETKKII